MQEGQRQCKFCEECEQPTGEDGLCDNHRAPYYRKHPDEAPPGWRHAPDPAKMTVAQLNEKGVKVGLAGDGCVVPLKSLAEEERAYLAGLDNGGH